MKNEIWRCWWNPPPQYEWGFFVTKISFSYKSCLISTSISMFQWILDCILSALCPRKIWVLYGMPKIRNSKNENVGEIPPVFHSFWHQILKVLAIINIYYLVQKDGPFSVFYYFNHLI